ncbi:hypothetical protein ABW19_dt0206223 [Dactylella cylindrospora]|nr:hypothetical protein ABW19_dt0206223 [Dactylella cylindrospora]
MSTCISDSDSGSPRPFILVASLPRSGTFSLKLGLETLGFGPTLHMSVFTGNRPLTDVWIPALQSPSTTNWPLVFKDFGSALDEPQSSVTLDILRGYLAAGRPIKVILLKRDPETWWASYTNTVEPYWIPGTFPFLAIKYIAASIPGAMMLYHCYFMEHIDWTRYRKTYMLEYQEQVRSFVNGINDGSIEIPVEPGVQDKPKVEFMEYTITDGWDPLCRFLGVEKPDTAFPKVNQGNELGKSYWRRIYKGTALWTLYLGIGILGIDMLRNGPRYAGVWGSIKRAIAR